MQNWNSKCTTVFPEFRMAIAFKIAFLQTQFGKYPDNNFMFLGPRELPRGQKYRLSTWQTLNVLPHPWLPSQKSKPSGTLTTFLGALSRKFKIGEAYHKERISKKKVHFSRLHLWISGHEQHPHPQQYYGHYDHHQQNYAPVHHQGYNQQQQWYPQQQGGYQQEYQYRMPAQDQQHQYHHQMYDQLPMQQPAQHPHSGDSNFNSQFSDFVKGGFHGFLLLIKLMPMT